MRIISTIKYTQPRDNLLFHIHQWLTLEDKNSVIRLYQLREGSINHKIHSQEETDYFSIFISSQHYKPQNIFCWIHSKTIPVLYLNRAHLSEKFFSENKLHFDEMIMMSALYKTNRLS